MYTKIIFNIFIIACFNFNALAQKETIRADYITDSFYFEIKNKFDSDTLRCNTVSAIIGLNNIAKFYDQIKFSKYDTKEDSIFQYFKFVFDNYPHECYYFYFDKEDNAKKYIDSLYPMKWPISYNYMYNIIDSIKLTYNKQLQKILINILAADQRDRNNFDKLLSNKTVDERKLKKVATQLDKNDFKRLSQIDSIIKIHGYPGKTLVSAKLSSIAVTIIQHGQSEYQIKYLDLLTDAVNKGELYKAEFAYFIDRLLIGTGRKQLFGNQYSIINGKVYFFPIGHPETVDQRRRKCNLWSLDKYKESIYDEMHKNIIE